MIGFVNTLIGKLNELGLNKVFEFLKNTAEIFEGLIGDAAKEVDKTRQNAEGAAPAVADLKDQVLEMPQPVKDTADNMERIAKSTGDANGKAKELSAETNNTADKAKLLAKENALIAEKIQLQKQLQEEHKQATGEGVQRTQQLADGNKRQSNAERLAQNQASATAQINEGAGAAGRLASEQSERLLHLLVVLAAGMAAVVMARRSGQMLIGASLLRKLTLKLARLSTRQMMKLNAKRTS